MANIIARLGVVLGLNSAEFVKGIDAASKKLDQLSDAARKYSAIASTAMVAASVAALKYADDIVDTAKANDMAVDSIVKLSSALALSGGKSSDAGKLLSSFTGFVDKAADGSLEAQKTFAKLGISLKDLGQLSSRELFDKTIRALSEIEDPITRNAKAMDVLGKAAKGVDLNSLFEQMRDGASIADEQAKAIEDAAEVYDVITKAGQEFMLMLATQLGPTLKSSIEYLKELSNTGLNISPVFKIAFETVAVLGANVVFVVKTLVQDVAALIRVVGALASFNGKEAGSIVREAISRAEQDRLALDKFEARVLGTGDGRRGMDDPRIVRSGAAATGRIVTPAKDPETERRRREEERERERLEKLILARQAEAVVLQEQQTAELAKYLDLRQTNYLQTEQAQFAEKDRLALQKEILALEVNKARLLPEEIAFRKELLQLEYEHKRNLDNIANKEISREDREKANRQETENYYQRIALAQQGLSQSMEQRSGSFQQGFFGKMQDVFRDLPTELQNGAQAFDSVFGNMNRALDNFVRTGKLSFKDLTRSIIQDLIQIQLRSQMTSLFKTFVGSIFGGAGGGFGTGNAFGNQDLGGFYADGGSPPVGRASVVGERGPELFIPNTAGTIIPNNALSGMGGVTNVTNNYINAIDVKSFEERLLGSSNTVWAANQYANKSLATGRGRT